MANRSDMVIIPKIQTSGMSSSCWWEYKAPLESIFCSRQSILFPILTTLVWHLFPVCPNPCSSWGFVISVVIKVVMFFSFMTIGWFVRSITPKLLNSFLLNPDGRWDLTRIRCHWLLVRIRIKGQIWEFSPLSLPLWDKRVFFPQHFC